MRRYRICADPFFALVFTHFFSLHPLQRFFLLGCPIFEFRAPFSRFCVISGSPSSLTRDKVTHTLFYFFFFFFFFFFYEPLALPLNSLSSCPFLCSQTALSPRRLHPTISYYISFLFSLRHSQSINLANDSMPWPPFSIFFVVYSGLFTS
jgi:hypothetical protein